MSGIGAAIIGGSLVTGALSASAQKDAANTAAQAQLQANQQALAAQQANFKQGVDYQDKTLAGGNALAGNVNSQLAALFAPYLAAGASGIGALNAIQGQGLSALTRQGDLAGANGDAAQNAAIGNLSNSPLFKQLYQQGEDAILQNQSATGMLRSGNTDAQLGFFRPQLLNSLLQQQFGNLSVLSGLGAGSANTLAGLGSSASNTQGGLNTNVLGQQLALSGTTAGNVANLGGANTSAVTNLLGQQGQIGANNALAQGAASAGFFNGLGSSINLASLLGAKGLLAGGQSGFSGLLPGSGGSLGPNEGMSLINALSHGNSGIVQGVTI